MKQEIHHCCFEEWDREHHCMGHCKSEATHRIGNNYVCEEHAKYSEAVRSCLSKDTVYVERIK